MHGSSYLLGLINSILIKRYHTIYKVLMNKFYKAVTDVEKDLIHAEQVGSHLWALVV